jgi:hypothetical protein
MLMSLWLSCDRAAHLCVCVQQRPGRHRRCQVCRCVCDELVWCLTGGGTPAACSDASSSHHTFATAVSALVSACRRSPAAAAAARCVLLPASVRSTGLGLVRLHARTFATAPFHVLTPVRLLHRRRSEAAAAAARCVNALMGRLEAACACHQHAQSFLLLLLLLVPRRAMCCV